MKPHFLRQRKMRSLVSCFYFFEKFIKTLLGIVRIYCCGCYYLGIFKERQSRMDKLDWRWRMWIGVVKFVTLDKITQIFS